MLTIPGSVEELYIARDGETTCRPQLQGDVFSGITIPGVGLPHDYAMIASHPCTMRRGPRLVERVKMIPVTTYQDVQLDRWTDSHFRVCPLPELVGGQNFAARFDEIGMVASAELALDKRVAVLSKHGILLLQQRLIFCDTRVAVKIPTLQKASAAVFAEAELLEEWNEAFADDLTDVDALEREAVEFDEFLKTDQSGSTLRAMLTDEHRRSSVRKAVREEIKMRIVTRPG